jgi:hypothetical protein
MAHLDMRRVDLDPAHIDRLAQVAVELTERVRDDNPEANARWLATALPDPADHFRLLFVLAAAVPDDRPWSHLTAWARHRAANQAA